MYNEIQKCDLCRNGLFCITHKFQKKHEFIEKKKSEIKKPKKTAIMNKRNQRTTGSVGYVKPAGVS